MILASLLVSFFIFAQADVKFEKRGIRFSNGTQLTVEVARTDEQRGHGLMFRQSLKSGTGMLFEFPQEAPLGFWMKNTLIPLSIGYFDKNRTLIEVIDMEPPVGPVRDENLPRYPSSRPAMFALEVPKGWFLEKKIKPGSKFSYKK